MSLLQSPNGDTPSGSLQQPISIEIHMATRPGEAHEIRWSRELIGQRFQGHSHSCANSANWIITGERASAEVVPCPMWRLREWNDCQMHARRIKANAACGGNDLISPTD
jgi:hypothetical protein